MTANDDAGISSDIKPLCYSCHDGTTATAGVARVFSPSHTNHRTRAASALRTSGSTAGQPYGPGRDCDLCHDPHDDGNTNFRVVNADGSISTTQAWTGASSFLKYERRGGTAPNFTYTTLYPGGDVCGSCHSGNMANSATAKTHPLDKVPGANTALSKPPVDGTWLPEVAPTTPAPGCTTWPRTNRQVPVARSSASRAITRTERNPPLRTRAPAAWCGEYHPLAQHHGSGPG